MADGQPVVPARQPARELPAWRPPCSGAEHDAAAVMADRLRACGLDPQMQATRALTSPVWIPLLRTVARVWASAFLAAGWQEAAIGLAAASIAGGIPAVGGAIRFLPLLGARTSSVVAVRRGGAREQRRPLVVVAHLDTHATAGEPMHRLHAALAALSAWAVVLAAVLGQPDVPGSRPVAAFVALECVLTMAWLARRELRTPKHTPDDNTSGLMTLIRMAEVGARSAPGADTWIVATGAGTSGGWGMRAFLASRPDLADAWLVEIDALGAGEIVIVPLAARFPYPGTPTPLVRAVEEAATRASDPLTVRRVIRGHSDARVALRTRRAGIVITGGLHPPAGGAVPDPANAERAAQIVARLSEA